MRRELRGYYAASSGNFLPAFRDKLSVPSARVKNLIYFGGGSLKSRKEELRFTLELSCLLVTYPITTPGYRFTVSFPVRYIQLPVLFRSVRTKCYAYIRGNESIFMRICTNLFCTHLDGRENISSGRDNLAPFCGEVILFFVGNFTILRPRCLNIFTQIRK